MINCPICGVNFNPYTRGRTKIYCSDDCRNYFKHKEALERILIRLEPDIRHSKFIKGDMFRLANLMPNGTNSSSKDN